MLVACVGDAHDAMGVAYGDVSRLEADQGEPVALVLQAGDLGRIPGGHIPRETVFIAGNTPPPEGFPTGTEKIKENLTFLASGELLEVETNGLNLRIGAVGGSYHTPDFPGRAAAHPEHYCRGQCEALMEQAPHGLDVFISHDAPEGLLLNRLFDPGLTRDENRPTEGLLPLILSLRPALSMHGHLHMPALRRIEGSPAVGLSRCPDPGSVVIFRLSSPPGAPLQATWVACNQEDQLRAECVGPPVTDAQVKADPEVIAELLAILTEWAQRHPTASLTQPERKVVAAQLKEAPFGRLLTAALYCPDMEDGLRRTIPLHQRPAALVTWQRDGLPSLAMPGSQD